MTAKIFRCSIWFIILSILVACGKVVPSSPTASPIVVTETNTTFFLTSTTDPDKPTSTPSPVPPASFTPTHQIWLSTARAINAAANTATQQSRDQMATQAAQFPAACENNHPINEVSPDGNWLATTCGYTRDQSLIVQNKGGAKWVLEFKEFLSPTTIQDGGVPMGSLYPKFWSPDGAYLYFTPVIGYDGGGDECFPGFGDDGLFRLDLKSGSWATLIPPTDSLLGYEIKFSPTGRRYATDMNGVTITDLKTGIVSRIDVSDTVEGLSWSPDGAQLAFTIAKCEEQEGTVQSSTVYLWDALKNEKRNLFTTNEMVLRPESWVDSSTLRIRGNKIVDLNNLYTIYVFNTAENNIVFSGTATPEP